MSTSDIKLCSLSYAIQGIVLAATISTGQASAVENGTGTELIDRIEFAPVSTNSMDVSAGNTDVLQMVQIHFSEPIQLRSQQAEGSGQRWLLEIETTPLVQGMGVESKTEQASRSRSSQNFGYQANRAALLQNIRVLQIVGRVIKLELEFSFPVHISATLQRNLRSIAVAISSPVTPKHSETSAKAAENQATELMASARHALIDERNFGLAASLYRQVLALPANSYSANALEYLGLSQERQGLLKPAIRTYQLYLERYKERSNRDSSALNVEPADHKQALIRIRQRLNSLLTAASQPKPSLQALRRHKDEPEWSSWGSWSQFLRYDLVQVSGGERKNTAAVLSNDLDWSLQRQHGSQRDRFRVSAGYYANVGEDEGGGNPQRKRISSVYYEHQDRNGWLELAKIGRFTSQRDGTLGRYDGARLEFGLSETVRLGVVAGYPVNSSRDGFSETIGGQRRFYGLSLELSPWDTGPDVSLYGIEQTDSGLVDRRAVGTEFRYFDHGLTLFGLLDYDIHFQQLNIGLIQGSLTLDGGTTLSASYDDRLSPVLTSNNALLGQIDSDGLPITDMTSLRQTHTDQDIQKLAQDRTARSQTLTLAASIPVGDQMRWASDLTLGQTGATQASDGVAATSTSGLQAFLNTRLTGNGWLSDNDIATVGLRTSDSDVLQVFGGYFSHRAPLAQRWRLYSNLNIEQRQWHTNGQQQQRVLPGLRLDYRRGNMTLEAELDAEWIDTQAGSDSLTGDEQSTGWYFNLGYRYDF